MYKLQIHKKSIIALFCGLCLTGCGLKGPLTLPKEPLEKDTFYRE